MCVDTYCPPLLARLLVLPLQPANETLMMGAGLLTAAISLVAVSQPLIDPGRNLGSMRECDTAFYGPGGS